MVLDASVAWGPLSRQIGNRRLDQRLLRSGVSVPEMLAGLPPRPVTAATIRQLGSDFLLSMGDAPKLRHT